MGKAMGGKLSRNSAAGAAPATTRSVDFFLALIPFWMNFGSKVLPHCR
jgi:hypothetical protein